MNNWKSIFPTFSALFFLLQQSDMFYYYLLVVYCRWLLSFTSLSRSLAVDPKWHFTESIFKQKCLFNTFRSWGMDLPLRPFDYCVSKVSQLSFWLIVYNRIFKTDKEKKVFLSNLHFLFDHSSSLKVTMKKSMACLAEPVITQI